MIARMNYRTWPRLLLLVLSLGVCGPAQDSIKESDPSTATLKTAGSWNGRFWRTLTEDQKITFLLGYSEGVLVAAMAESSDFEHYRKVSDRLWPRALTVREVRDSLDQIYATPENGPIGLPNAVFIVVQRTNGVDEQTLQKKLADMRASASKM